MENYKDLMRKVLHEGIGVPDRTGTGTVELFAERLKFDLSDGFPLVTGKATSFKVVAEELRWMLSGSTNTNDLDSTIWDEWANADGELGPIYGHQWRKLEVDQIKGLIGGLKRDPHSRRHIVDSWNVEQLKGMSLTPCHNFFQVNVTLTRVHLHMYQRSADMFIGVPYNIAFYALLTELIAFELGLVAGELTISFGSTHIYMNHIDKVMEYLERDLYSLPVLHVSSSDIVNAEFDAQILGYICGSRIRAEVAV